MMMMTRLALELKMSFSYDEMDLINVSLALLWKKQYELAPGCQRVVQFSV